MASQNPDKNVNDIVARWEVPLSGEVYSIEFEHGTTSGKRVIYINGKEIRRNDYMFKLVGTEAFQLGSTRCVIHIDALNGFAYEYTLEVNGKNLDKFTESQSKVMHCWVFPLEGSCQRVVMEKDTVEVFVNGRKVETLGEFTDEGTETHFEIGSHSCYIKTVSSGHRRSGLIHSLMVDDCVIPEAPVDQYLQWCAANRF